MDSFTIHITGTQTNDDGTVDVIDTTDTGAYLFAICGTAEEAEGGEKHNGAVHMHGMWGFIELEETFYHMTRCFENPIPMMAAMLAAIRRRKKEMADKAPAPEAAP